MAGAGDMVATVAQGVAAVEAVGSAERLRA